MNTNNMKLKLSNRIIIAKFTNMWKLKAHFWTISKSKKKSKENQNDLETNNNGIQHKKTMGCNKSSYKKKFIELNAYIKKVLERFQIKTLYCKEL